MANSNSDVRCILTKNGDNIALAIKSLLSSPLYSLDNEWRAIIGDVALFVSMSDDGLSISVWPIATAAGCECEVEDDVEAARRQV